VRFCLPLISYGTAHAAIQPNSFKNSAAGRLGRRLLQHHAKAGRLAAYLTT
jgi:hypothetical protein